MLEAFVFAWAGTLGLIFGWVYLRTYKDPTRDGLSRFIHSWYERNAMPSIGGRSMVRLLGFSLAFFGVVLWLVAFWKLLTAS